MQFTTAILALAAAVSAAPNLSSRGECTFGQYECSADGRSIIQCDIAGNWITVGPCPHGDYCGYSDENDLPYCYGPKKEKRGNSPPYCTTPGTYSCTPDDRGINVCNAENQLLFNGACPKDTHCEPIASAGGIPFCVENTY
ncbi:hypothetical protein M406DRAFT_355969 [Cryphonectria parasitica EP155]|uniref:Uncharacterized protein n=1 Tax=Cryphonectria parasitica (strain ATCC 38755 / EP155) TaxID=660469 RepID=A0A9P4Y2U6_CRYP1|nr:uncharacterized protein M406DRAFT_355969 [Cryphonectria parasitica EP155]KAF3765551.1 hypothetical protein M406DRAFT_355969 [Cryphonectria parasitica EP155]